MTIGKKKNFLNQKEIVAEELFAILATLLEIQAAIEITSRKKMCGFSSRHAVLFLARAFSYSKTGV